MPFILTTKISTTLIDQTADLMWTPVDAPVGVPTEGADTLYGTQAGDALNGYGGDDTLYGKGGDDYLFGGQGNDTLHGGSGADRMDGGDGSDWVSYSGSQAVTVDLRDRGFGGDAEGDTYLNIENVSGSSYADVLLGNATNNTLNGMNGSDYLFGDFGNDILNGGSGRDILEGGAGNDTLDGGMGYDTLIGGSGADKFVFRPSGGGDTIVDFEVGIDKIVLDARGGSRDPNADVFDSPFGRDGKLACGYFREDGSFAGTGLDGSDGVIYLTDTNQLVAVDSLTAINGNWHLEGTELARLNVDVSQSDFLLI
jgi:serralysin